MSRMSRTLALTLTIAIPLAVLAAVLYTLRPSPVAEAPAIRARTPEPAAPAAAPRIQRGLSLDDAIKELELIRPPRPKFADDFTIATAAGTSFRLSAHRGRPVFMNFWATWCPPCLEEMPAMERLWRGQKDAGFVLVAISLDADPKKVPPFVSARKFSFPIALDPKMAVAERYGVRALPSSFVVDRQGMMAGVALGPRSWDDSAAHGLVQAMLR